MHFLLDGASIGLLDVFGYVAILAVAGTAVRGGGVRDSGLQGHFGTIVGVAVLLLLHSK